MECYLSYRHLAQIHVHVSSRCTEALFVTRIQMAMRSALRRSSGVDWNNYDFIDGKCVPKLKINPIRSSFLLPSKPAASFHAST